MVAKRTSLKPKNTRSRRSDRSTKDGGTRFQIPQIARDILLCFGLFLLLVFVYRDYIIEGKVDVVPDSLNQGAPFDRFAVEFSETYDSTPLWYPHIFSGMPFQASGSYQSLQYSYETLLLILLPDSLFRGLHGRYLFHLLLGAISMFLLARALSLSRPAAFIAAAAFILNSHVVGTDHVNRLASFMHIPLIFLAVYRLFERYHIIWAILLGGAFGSQIGSYHPQIAHYTGMMLGLYVVYMVIMHLLDKKPVKPLVLSCGLFGLALVLATAIAAVIVLPMQEYAQFSARNLSVGGETANVPFATSWSFSPAEVFTFVLPSFSGFGGQTYWGEMPFTDFPNYLGVVVVALAFIGLILHRDRMTVFLAILALFALFVSFGRHMSWFSYIMLNFVPFFSKFRAPVMILILLQFAVAILAGYGVQALKDLVRQQSPSRLVRILGFSMGGILAFTFFLFLSGSSFQSFMTSIYTQADLVHGSRQAIATDANIQTQINAIRFDVFMDDLLLMTFLFSSAALVMILYLTRRIGDGLFFVGIAVLAVLDLLIVAGRLIDPQYMPGRIDSFYTARQQEPIVQAMHQDTDLFRIFPVDELSTNQYGFFGFSSIGGYHAAKLGIYEELMTQVGLNSFSVLNMLNTKYLISRQKLTGALLAPVIESEQGNLYRNVTALPRAFLVDSLTVITSKGAIFETMKQPTFDPARVAILEEPIETSLGPVASSEVAFTNYTPHRIDIMVQTSAPALLVLSEVYYPAGWSAIIDGEPTKIYKTNYVLRSVVVPAGQHDITFVYEPSSFNTGHTLSLISSILVLLALIGTGAWRVREKLEERKQS